MFRFNGEDYPTRLIALDMPEISGQRLISVDSLDVALMTKDGCYVSEEARDIDEEVFFYVPDKMIDAEENILIQYVKDMVA
ncbi:hypothetical protein [Selenomonas ruminantium]|uniref:hypothetical protein n=1 Tax=Selenomonas ruminantium TaxID=971 RepID=UPI0026ED524D|nr:hypothetical protein [Selenomonas ruminantium]